MVKVYGNNPSRFESIIKITVPARNRDHFCPFGESWWIMLYSIVFRNHLIIVVIRFPSSEWFEWIMMMGISIEPIVTGMNNTSGLANCSNMFMFMVGLVCVLCCLLICCFFPVHYLLLFFEFFML